ncbi:hypothetical protein [Nostoc linckia]|uniref:hypothetical protein n=1 Tax=Nostoc linckia TaxID=92942 RepID=UPI00117FF6AD|nr:hypothetical protein [Nostoc linckia]
MIKGTLDHPKYTIIVETAADGTLWGQILYDGDLLTANAYSEQALKECFVNQFRGFYDIKLAADSFEIRPIDGDAIGAALKQIYTIVGKKRDDTNGNTI